MVILAQKLSVNGDKSNKQEKLDRTNLLSNPSGSDAASIINGSPYSPDPASLNGKINVARK